MSPVPSRLVVMRSRCIENPVTEAIWSYKSSADLGMTVSWYGVPGKALPSPIVW
jgi:hypothetical protein